MVNWRMRTKYGLIFYYNTQPFLNFSLLGILILKINLIIQIIKDKNEKLQSLDEFKF